MRLPDGDGLAVVDHVAKHHPNLPVAVITAFGSAENAVAALKAGAFDYVSKPVGLEQLRALVKSALSLPERAEPSARGLLGASAPLAQARELCAANRATLEYVDDTPGAHFRIQCREART